MAFSFIEIEKEVRDFWQNAKVYEILKNRNKGKKKFFYLDGPPYTNAKIHIGHAWGKALRDSIMRYKRMNNFDVFDTPGFDMHGLPIEVEVEKTLGIKSKKEIEEKVGIHKFIQTCKKFALEMMYPMIEEFKFMGVWMGWDNPYMTISKTYIENLWFILKKAYEQGLLYKDKATMTWCPRCETALAKHELQYETLTDNSIYVKFPLRDKPNHYLIIWTTTPWTLPFNLAVMVHPDYDYVKAEVEVNGSKETWYVAEAMAAGLITAVAGYKYKVLEKIKGSQLEGLSYYPPFYEWSQVKFHDKYEWAFKVILSSEYVDLSAGSGLVHCAPGCGKEDNEVGRKYGLPAFNTVDESGNFNEGPFKGLKAKVDDARFIQMLKEKDLIVAEVPIEHEYAVCWRCRTPIIFRATEQWYLKVSDLKQKAIEENSKVKWIPDWAGSRAFNSWLENLSDWCISRQRYWGTPLPIWVCENNHIHVVGSVEELENLTNKKFDDLHKDTLDNVTFKCKECNSEMRRVPDVLDVWLDSGGAPFSVLDYVNNRDVFNKWFPCDLILEGKDQIRGWFNSLMNMSMIVLQKAPYKAVYMHGFINDALGRKMSKSLKNYITPREVWDKWGVDVFRYYAIGAAEPGENLNYNFKDVDVKFRNLQVFWNLHKWLKQYIEVIKENNKSFDLTNNDEWVIKNYENLMYVSRYIVNFVNNAIKDATNAFENYALNRVPWILEEAYLELSKLYIQAVREISTFGTLEEKEEILRVVAYCLKKINIALSPIIPFITEKIYQNLRDELGLKEISVHLEVWPKVDIEIDSQILEDFKIVDKVIQILQRIRDKIGRGIRWPIKEVVIYNIPLSSESKDLIKNMLNIKSIVEKDLNIKPKLFVKENFVDLVKGKEDEIISSLMDGKAIKIGEVNAKDIASIEYELDGYEIEALGKGYVAVNLEMSEDLMQEGYARELMRRIQEMRKKKGLQKTDKIVLSITTEIDLSDLEDEIKTKTSSTEIKWNSEHFHNITEFQIKGKTFKVSFKKI